MNQPLQTVRQIAAAVQSHQVTARAMADAALAAAARHQDRFRAFIRLTPAYAHRAAEQVDALVGQNRRLPLAGVPFAVKDLIDVEGLPTTCGSRAFAQRVPRHTATVVGRLQAAGAVLIGKLNLHECAFGFTGENPTFGNCRNPWNPERIAGGSSSGSAVAVALGICPFTLGSDTGGSIRHPAALCGISGIKPTYGRVSRAGVEPLSWTFDHLGPMAHSAEDLALILQVMAGADPADDSCSTAEVPDYSAGLARPLNGLKLGVPRNWFFADLEPDVERATRAALQQLRQLGAEQVDVELPHLEEVVGAHRAILFAEASSYQQPHLAAHPELFGDDIRPLLQAGLYLGALDYLKGQRVRRLVRAAWAQEFNRCDVLATPTTPLVATRFGQQSAALPGGEKPLVRAYLDLTLPFNFSGHPALSIPCGFSAQRLPIGLQLVGRPWDESLLLRVAHQYQSLTAWHRQRPPV